MATYKVPQDVEADDKLLGPFTFRQFIYLMIVFGLLMLTIGLFQVFPLLAIVPIPFMFFFAILALPLKKDQPMETYLAALLSFHTKPNKRYWLPGQSESTILITAPKQVEVVRARNLTGDEASHRLSFLADIVDSEGHAIKNASTNMKDDFYAEAYNTTDMFDRGNNYGLSNIMIQQEEERRAAVVDEMRDAINRSEFSDTVQLPSQRIVQPRADFDASSIDTYNNAAPYTSTGYETPTAQAIYSAPTDMPADPYSTPGYGAYMGPTAYSQPAPVNPSTGENIQQEADRIRAENESEVFVSLH